MIKPDPDWVFLRQGMLLPAICLLVGTALWGTTTMYRTRLTNTLETERQELASIEQERKELISRREAREQYSAIYQQLTTDRIVGPEQRLQWVQSIRTSTESLGLPYMRYSARPQEAFEAPYLVNGMTAPVISSPMDIQLGLVHEMDLLRLIDSLASSAGLFHVRSCQLDRLARDTAPASDQANITGSCELTWFSIPASSSVAAVNHEE